MRSRRWRAAMAGAAVGVAVAAAPAGAQDVYTAAGPDPAAIQATVDEFRAALGTLNANTPGTRFSGRREINWDGVPPQFAAPNELPADFFNVNSPRGVVFEAADGFQVSGEPPLFGNPQFRTFSAPRLFTSLGTPDYVVAFRIPGEDTPALSRGFGAVFTDVDVVGSTSIELRQVDGTLLATAEAPPAPGGLSFAGVVVEPAAPAPALVVVRQGTALPGTGDGADDAVAADDFIYGEPTIQCGESVPTRVGTEGDDSLVGTAGDDVLAGLDGEDRIAGAGGDDQVCGGPGADLVTGGNGDDFVDGADETTVFRYFEQGLELDEADKIQGDHGSDFVVAFAGDDRAYGGAGDDFVGGELDSDRLNAGSGDDTIIGAGDPAEEGDDVMIGEGGDDFMLDGVGGDAAHGGPGDDFAFTGEGDDFAAGGPGSDWMGGPFELIDDEGTVLEVLFEEGDDVFLGGLGDDLLDGGPGRDHLNGEQDADACLNGETVRNCEVTEAPQRSAARAAQAVRTGSFASRY